MLFVFMISDLYIILNMTPPNHLWFIVSINMRNSYTDIMIPHYNLISSSCFLETFNVHFIGLLQIEYEELRRHHANHLWRFQAASCSVTPGRPECASIVEKRHSKKCRLLGVGVVRPLTTVDMFSRPLLSVLREAIDTIAGEKSTC